MINKILKHYKENGLLNTIKWLYHCLKYKIYKVKIDSQNMEYLFDKTKKNKFISKEGKNVFIFGTVPYYDIGGGQRSSQLAKTFNKMGFKVFYIYAFSSSESKRFSIEVPCVLHSYIDHIDIEYLNNFVNENDLAIFEAPCAKFNDYLELFKLKKAKVVYENIDNWESSLGTMLFDKETLYNFIKKSDLLVGTAQPLVKQLKEYCNQLKVNKKIEYLPNAVDDELFNGRKEFEIPTDMVKGSKTLLYYGSLWGEWFDWDILFELATMNPRISINLIGDYSGIKNIVSNSPVNIHFLGLKKQIELPSYLYNCDYAILPFKTGKIGDFVSPLKIFEYISMNKKIISTRLPDIENYPNISFGDNFKEWNECLKESFNMDINISEEFIRNNNWNDRTQKLLKDLYIEYNEKCDGEYYNNISIVTLNYNNLNVIFRLIETLKINRKRYNYEIIVVDNQSTDGSYEKIKAKYKNEKFIKILRNSKNGCSSGRNLGVKNSNNDYIVFLDSDEWILNEFWLDNYINLFKKMNNKCVIGWGAGWFNKNGLAYHVVDSFQHRYLPPNFIATNDIGYLATCGFMIKKDLFNKIGCFDEAYDPTCYEDTDLSLAIRNEGVEIYFSKYLGVGHLPHQTTKSGTFAHSELINKKGKYFVKKWKTINKKLIFDYIKINLK